MFRLAVRRTPQHGGVDEGHYAQEATGVRLAILRILNWLDLVVYTLVGLAFVAAAVLAFVFSISHLLLGFQMVLPFNFDARIVLDFVSDLLLVIIIMELLFTIRSYVEKGDTLVEPFLIIGIISATRGILSIGARLYIAGATLTPEEFRSAMIELAVNALVIIVLGITIRILDGVSLHQESGATPGRPSTDSAHDAPQPANQHPQ